MLLFYDHLQATLGKCNAECESTYLDMVIYFCRLNFCTIESLSVSVSVFNKKKLTFKYKTKTKKKIQIGFSNFNK